MNNGKAVNDMSNGKFEIFKGSNSQFYFRLKAGNGEIIGSSEGYTSKQGAEVGISSVKTNAPYSSRYSVFTGRDNQYYFNLKSGNNEIILKSEGYTSKQSAESGIESVKKNAPTAPIHDLT